MTKDTIITFDGAWSHRRRAKECVVTIIDTKQKKVVDYEVVTKTKCGTPGDWEGSANGMEIEALRRMLPRWVGNENVCGVVHDNDAKASQLIHDLDWDVEEYFDPNHVCKQFERRWNSHPHSHLRGVHAKLLAWFRYLIHCDCSVARKQTCWMNSLEHFKGNHAHCPREHPDSASGRLVKTQAAADELEQILQDTVELPGRALPGLNTQLCESFNSLKAKFATKDTSWRVSWPSRIDCAVLQMNCETDWRIPLARMCHLTLEQRLVQRMTRKWNSEQERKRARRTPEAQARACRLRWERRQQDNQQTAGRNDCQIARARHEEDFDDGEPDADAPMVPYDEVLAADPSIAVPAEPGDDRIRIVRNRRNVYPPPQALDADEPGSDEADAFSEDELRSVPRRRRDRANYAGDTRPRSPIEVVLDLSYEPSADEPSDASGPQKFRDASTAFRDCAWQYCALPHNIRTRPWIEGFGSSDRTHKLLHEPARVPWVAHRSVGIDCHTSEDCDLRSVLASRQAAKRRVRRAPSVPVEYEDGHPDLGDDDDEDLDADDEEDEPFPRDRLLPEGFDDRVRRRDMELIIVALP
jgi:hypothetical protein